MKKQKLLKNLNSKGRYLALLLTVTAGLLYCSSAWGYSEHITVYFDNSEAKWTNVYHIVGRNNHTTANTMTLVSGTQYLYSCKVDYDDFAMQFFASRKDASGTGVGNDIYWNWYTLGEKGDGTTTFKYDNVFTDKNIYTTDGLGEASQEYSGTTHKWQAYKWGSSFAKADYKVTVNNGADGTEGTVTIKDYAGTTVTSGTSKCYLTVLKIDVTPNAGHTIATVSINGTDYTSQARLGTIEYTMKVATTIDVTYGTPTVLIGAKEKIEAQEVTLYGYVKYTGCKDISKVGFIASQTLSEVEGATPTATKYEGTASADPIEAGTDFSFSSDEFENATYYYRAWMKASDGTEVYSDEIRTFEPQGVCSITDAASILPIFKSGKTEESATFTGSSASIELTVEKTCIANVYQWNVVAHPGTATFTTGSKRNTTVTVDAVGTYTFTLTAGCTGGTQYTSTRVLTLHVCEPAEETQLYLDNHTNNVLCVGEKSTATCITKEGYTYSLYNPSGDNLGSLAGTGGTQKWRNVDGAGEFTMRTSPIEMPQCAAVVSRATQSYNEPTMEITADPGFSVISYQPVTLALKKVTSDTYVDTNPTWVITNGSDKAYLLNEHNRLAYDNRAREKVVFKGGATEASQITVEASAYKTVSVIDPDVTVANYTKQCPATVEVKLTVSPAVDDCDN